MRRSLAVLTVTAFILAAGTAQAAWPRHVIDDSSRGADGVRLLDLDGDGDQDIVTGWEEGGITRVYLNPGPDKAKERWPAVTVGKTPDVEDAVFGDFDGDGAVDVVSCCEGGTRTVFVHRAPKEPGRYLDPSAWTTEPVPASQGRMMWMFAERPAGGLDPRGQPAFFAAGKGKGAAVGWFRIPRGKERDLAAWTWHPIEKVGWVMSIVSVDMDRNGSLDIVLSDRRGPARGVFWLENPWANGDPADPDAWRRHDIGGKGREVMFLDYADLDGDGLRDVVVATKPRDILFCRRLPPAEARRKSGGATVCLSNRAPRAEHTDWQAIRGTRRGTPMLSQKRESMPPARSVEWEERTIRMPETAGTAKAVAVGDIDGDGRADLVFSCEAATPPRPGVMWLKNEPATFASADWPARDISGPEGVKFDRMELVDLDGDGDLDVLTCEERAGLGVIWYENPAR
ncbi:MAG: VCBS repeat-containing protein [Phycisphaerae bacterium]